MTSLTKHFSAEDIALARAYHGLFPKCSVRGVDIDSVSSSLAEKYGLSGVRLRNFCSTTDRVRKSVDRVRDLEGRFGVDDDGEFVDVAGLLAHVNDDKVNEGVVGDCSFASSRNFTIVFDMNHWNYCEHDTKIEGFTSFDGFVYVPSVERLTETSKPSDNAYMRALRSLQASAKQKAIIRHEMGHVYDMNLRGFISPFSEFFASLFERGQEDSLCPEGTHDNPLAHLYFDCKMLDSKGIELEAINRLPGLKRRYDFLSREKPRVLEVYNDCSDDERRILPYLIAIRYPRFPSGEAGGRQ